MDRVPEKDADTRLHHAFEPKRRFQANLRFGAFPPERETTTPSIPLVSPFVV
jgi:hypothetical protein